MPATRDESFEKCSLGSFPVQVKHLRVELVGELDDLLLGDVQRLRFEAVTYFQIVEVMLFHSG